MGPNFTALLSSTALIATSATAALADTIVVTEPTEAAINAALASAAASETASQIVLAFADDVTLEATLAYGGMAPLALIGSGQTLSTANDVTLLASTNGGDLRIDLRWCRRRWDRA